MFTKQIKIWLAGLICFSSMGGFSQVICYGSDGHVAMEPVAHKHCDCPESDETASQYDLSGSVIDASPCPGHCTEQLATSGVILSSRKIIKPLSGKLVAAKLVPKTTSLHCPSVVICYSALRWDLSSFHDPLRTVVLLS